MGTQIKKKRDFEQLERRRMQAAKLLSRGLSQADVARRTKVSRESVRRWRNQILLHRSAQGLKKAGRVGRKARLGFAELEALKTILQGGPQKAGFRNGLWTLDRIAAVIREVFGWITTPGTYGGSCKRNSAGVASGR